MKNGLQTGCLILGILCLFYYVAITIYAGFRTSISWIWILGGAVFLLLYRAMRCQNAHPQPWLRSIIGIVLALIAAAVVVIVLIGSRIAGAMVAKPQPNLDYVVVLGAQVKGTKPSLSLQKRLERAVSYAEENPDTIFVLSGGQGPDEGISEAQCMYNYMTEAGIAKERLIMEDRSTSTKENLEFSAAFFNKEENSVGILSNDFHVYRGVELARAQGYGNASGIPAQSVLFMQPHNVLREICCVLVETQLKF